MTIIVGNIDHLFDGKETTEILSAFGLPSHVNVSPDRLRRILNRWVVKQIALLRRAPGVPPKSLVGFVESFFYAPRSTKNPGDYLPPYTFDQIGRLTDLDYIEGKIKSPLHNAYLFRARVSGLLHGNQVYSYERTFLEVLTRDEYRYVGYLTSWILSYIRLVRHTCKALGILDGANVLRGVQQRIDLLRTARNDFMRKHHYRPATDKPPYTRAYCLPPKVTDNSALERVALNARETKKLQKRYKRLLAVMPDDCRLLLDEVNHLVDESTKDPASAGLTLATYALANTSYVRPGFRVAYTKYLRRIITLERQIHRRTHPYDRTPDKRPAVIDTLFSLTGSGGGEQLATGPFNLA